MIKHKKAKSLKKFITLMAEAETGVLFDFLARWLTPLVNYDTDWGDIPGTEPDWMEYFHGEHLTPQHMVDGVMMYVTLWHNGMDNTDIPFVGLTNHLEAHNRAVKRRLQSARAECSRLGFRPGRKDGIDVLFNHFGKMFQAELVGLPRYQPDAVVRADRHPAVPDAIVRRQKTVQHNANYPAAEQLVGYTGHVEVPVGEDMYYVMPRKASDFAAGFRVDPADAALAVELRRLKPAPDYHQNRFLEAGLLKPYTREGCETATSEQMGNRKNH